MEIKLTEDTKIGIDDYIKVLEHKTASLFEASAKIGAILGGGGEEEIHALATFGNLLGIAYQIHDDLLDWNNEDRLFNILVKENEQSIEFVDKMEESIYPTLARQKMNYARYTIAQQGST